MKILIIFSIVLLSCAQGSGNLQWSDLVPTGNKKVGNPKTEWPVFSDKTVALNGQEVTIEGYFLSAEAMDIFKQEWKTINMVTCCERPTITICGVPQYKQYEFIVFDLPANTGVKTSDKVSVTGKLNLNTTADKDRNLIRLENISICKI